MDEGREWGVCVGGRGDGGGGRGGVAAGFAARREPMGDGVREAALPLLPLALLCVASPS